MQSLLVVVYEDRGRVVLDLDGDELKLSTDEAREIARALNEAAERCAAPTGNKCDE